MMPSAPEPRISQQSDTRTIYFALKKNQSKRLTPCTSGVLTEYDTRSVKYGKKSERNIYKKYFAENQLRAAARRQSKQLKTKEDARQTNEYK